MTKYNPKNERIKRDYFRYQTDAEGKAESTMKGIRKAILRFEEYTKYRDFATFNKEQAMGFKKNLLSQKSQRTGQPVSKTTALSTLNALKDFFRWLSWQSGYKSRIHVPDIEYFNLTDKEVSIAKSKRHKKFPTLEQIHKVITSMPTDTDIQRRDRAVVAFAILTGMRDSALASLRLRHVDVHCVSPLVKQEPDQVNTKFSKQILTYFFPVGDDIQAIALDWIRELREDHLYGENDPVFPRTQNGHDANHNFVPIGLEPECWSTATPIRKIFKEAFEAAGLPYFNPHSFRHTLVALAYKLCKTPEEFKAWSQNLGHESPMTTFTSYGSISVHKQGDVIANVGKKEAGDVGLNEILEYVRAEKQKKESFSKAKQH